jgi:hypothetical protein
MPAPPRERRARRGPYAGPVGGLAELKARYWCAIADVLGIRPWEIDSNLTPAEFATACRYVDQANQEGG